jgi:hypothetical protein
VYIVPKIIDSGYLVVGKKRVIFKRSASISSNSPNANSVGK